MKTGWMDRKKTGKWVMLCLLFLAFFTVNYAQFLLASYAEEFSSDFGISPVQLSVLTFSHTIVAGVIGMIGGMLADKFGSCKVMGILGILSTAGAVLRLFVTDYILFFICSLLVGMLFGGSLSVNGKIIRAWFDEKEQGLAFSILSTGSALSVIVAMFGYNWYRGYQDALISAAVLIGISSLLWLAVGRDAPNGIILAKSPDMIRNIPKSAMIKGFWSVTAGTLFYSALINSLAGKLSGVLVLQHGISMAEANVMTGVFSVFTLIGGCVLPLAQRKRGTFRPFLLSLFAIAVCCIGLLSVIPVSGIFPVLVILGLAVSVQHGMYSAVLSRLPGMKDEFLGSAMGLQVLVRFIVGVFVLVPYVVTPLIAFGANYYYMITGIFCVVQMIATLIMPEVGEKGDSGGSGLMKRRREKGGKIKSGRK